MRQLGILAIMIALVFTGCQRADDAVHQIPRTVEAVALPVIEARSLALKLPQTEICEAVGCTRYEMQSIQTNIAWINEYFLDRLKKMEPSAFEKYEGPELDRESLTALGLSQSRAYVRYIGQTGHVATFILHSDSYSSGAEQALYHDEYVNLDLKEQKRIGLQDILIAGKEREFADVLYQHNQKWLLSHNQSLETFQLSDNFYYGVKGLTLVYALYELTDYAGGMPELVLPLDQLAQFIQPEYLPPLPDYTNLDVADTTGE